MSSVESKTALKTALPSTNCSRRGRPPLCEVERCRRILQAAEEVFTTTGYGAATMEAIAKAAGMSKKTLYGLYPNKRQLLMAVTVAPDDFPWEDDERPALEDPLAELRQRMLASARFALTPRQLRLTRLLIAEAAHAPDLADDFYERVMSGYHSYLSAAVARAIDQGVGPEGGDVQKLTVALSGAALSELHLLALFGRSETSSDEQIATHVDTALAICGFSGIG